MCAREMAQPALDAIAGHSVSERSTDNEPDARPGARRVNRVGDNTNRLGDNTVRRLHGMDDQRGPTHSNPAASRPSEVLRVAHSQ